MKKVGSIKQMFVQPSTGLVVMEVLNPGGSETVYAGITRTLPAFRKAFPRKEISIPSRDGKVSWLTHQRIAYECDSFGFLQYFSPIGSGGEAEEARQWLIFGV
jgi:hypothetical protein